MKSKQGASSPDARVLEKAGAKIQEHKLANGLNVVMVERHLDPVVAVMVWYKVGSRNETERESGVSHFLEHMMFKGSARFGKGQVDHVTTTLGGSNNAFTTPDHTAYWFELASDRWEKALEIEADRMKSLLLDPVEFQSEKAVVLEELSMGNDDPWRNLSQEVHAALFPRHPYRRPVIGYADTLKALDVSEMRDYYRRFYHPANATLVLCGDFEPAEALVRVREHFESIPAGVPRTEADINRPEQEEPKGEHRLTMTWDDQASRLCIGWPTVAVGTDEDYALDLIATILSGGRTARLYRRLVLQSGLATSVSTHNDTRVDKGAFWLFAECAQNVDIKKLEEAVDRELAALRDGLVSSTELARAKKMLLASEAQDNETVTDLAEEIGEYAVDTDWRMALDIPNRLRGVTAKKIQDVARLLVPERRVVGWCVPREKKAAPEKPPKRSAATTKRGAATRAGADR